MYVPEVFDISYEPNRLQSARYADVRGWCASVGLPSRLYEGPDSVAAFGSGLGADFALAAGWYHMIPRAVREAFRAGCAGLHASLLPKCRGGAPLVWAMLAREREAGMTLFELGDGIDDGAVYGQRAFPIPPRGRIADLVKASALAAVTLTEHCLPRIAAGTLTPSAQHGAPSYGLQRAPRDGRIDWTKSTADIDLLVRAIGRPYPGASTTLGETTLYVWDVEPFDTVPIFGVPGQLARVPEAPDVCVVAGDGALVIRDATSADGESALPLLRRASNQRLT
jgi:methionyl-tRNA formyltransferase